MGTQGVLRAPDDGATTTTRQLQVPAHTSRLIDKLSELAGLVGELEMRLVCVLREEPVREVEHKEEVEGGLVPLADELAYCGERTSRIMGVVASIVDRLEV